MDVRFPFTTVCSGSAHLVPSLLVHSPTSSHFLSSYSFVSPPPERIRGSLGGRRLRDPGSGRPLIGDVRRRAFWLSKRLNSTFSSFSPPVPYTFSPRVGCRPGDFDFYYEPSRYPPALDEARILPLLVLFTEVEMTYPRDAFVLPQEVEHPALFPDCSFRASATTSRNVCTAGCRR